MKKLQQIWYELPLKSDKGDVHSYVSVYDEILAPYRTTAKNILEIGLFNGASLLMWEQYFEGAVFGIDCSKTPHDGIADLRPLIAMGTHKIVILNAENSIEVEKYFKDIRFDVIIEDAGHDIKQQRKIYEIFKQYMQKGGIYIIEDIQDIDKHKWFFKTIDEEKEITILDRRKLKNRYDDVIVIIKDKK